MTTKHSPLRRLKAQADQIAKNMKAAERGEIAVKPGSETVDPIKFGIVMDDKIITLEVPRAVIRDTSEAGLSEYVLDQMREVRNTVQ